MRPPPFFFFHSALWEIPPLGMQLTLAPESEDALRAVRANLAKTQAEVTSTAVTASRQTLGRARAATIGFLSTAILGSTFLVLRLLGVVTFGATDDPPHMEPSSGA